MEVNVDQGVEFRPNRSRKSLLMLYVACGIFISVGLCFMLFGSYEHVPMGMLMTGFSFFILILGHFFTTPSNIFYYVSEKGIVLKQGKTIRSIPYAEIESITPLKEDQGEELLVRLQNQLVDRQRKIMSITGQGEQPFPPPGLFGSLKKVFSEQFRAYDKFRFLSVPITYISSGRQRGPEKANAADLPYDTIFILQKNGEGYLISPQDIDGFTREAKKHLGP